MARVTFTVPPSRGAQSEVVDPGRRRRPADPAVDRRARPCDISVGDNDRAHSVSLRVCNEKGNCSRSAAKAVQAYGPLRRRPHHLRRAAPSEESATTPTRSGGRSPSTPTATRAACEITSRSGDRDAPRNETRPADRRRRADLHDREGRDPGVHVRHHPGPRSTTPRPRAAEVHDEFRLHHAGAQAAEGDRHARARSAATRPAAAFPRATPAAAGVDCVDPSCARIGSTTRELHRRPTIRCEFWDNVDGQFTVEERRLQHARTEPGSYFGYPGRQVWAVCNGDRVQPLHLAPVMTTLMPPNERRPT